MQVAKVIFQLIREGGGVSYLGGTKTQNSLGEVIHFTKGSTVLECFTRLSLKDTIKTIQ